MTTQILVRMPDGEQRNLKAWTALSGTTIQKFVYELIPRQILEGVAERTTTQEPTGPQQQGISPTAKEQRP